MNSPLSRLFPRENRLALLLLALTPFTLLAAQNKFVQTNDVVWTSPGTNENDSMPLGNGDIALNVWTEQNGDIVLLIAKADAWSENGQLLKLGQVRVTPSPNPFAGAASFTQTLRLESGEVVLQSGKNLLSVWVDANHPVIHVELQTEQPVTLAAKSEIWRRQSYHLDQARVGRGGFFEWGNNPQGLDFEPDTVLPPDKNCVSWCHFNSNSIYPLVLEQEHLQSLLAKYPDPLLHRCFGVAMKGPDFNNDGDLTLRSAKPARSQHLELYALTTQCDSPAAWRAALAKTIASADVSLRAARAAHLQWWTDFWDRSWIHVGGSPDAEKISQSYTLQRYMTACCGRGAQPIKFNGSLFTVGHILREGRTSSDADHDPDFRAWGNSYWNQNTRLVYWPLLASGDFDLLAPWLNMYVQDLPLAAARTSQYFHHAGASFIETMYFWGLPNLNDFGWNNSGVEVQSEWMRYHIQGGLEVLAQMLDRYQYTLDQDFARRSLLPLADGVITYYDQHWKRGSDGKILMSPAQSIETYQRDAVNPTPDVAGLRSVLPRLLALPGGLGNAAQRALWTKVLHDLPALPTGKTTRAGKLPRRGQTADPAGHTILLPAQEFGPTRNSENPELYTVFPYRLYGVGKPDLTLARDTFAARLFPFAKCWGQDGIEAALLGLSDQAKKVALTEFTSYGGQRFRWFWSRNSDWIPDMDNGGAGMETLQLMLLQCDGPRIQLLPAWPADWTADFKLCAPDKTTVEGHVENGKLSHLKVTPQKRTKDVVIVAPQQ